MNNAKFLSVVLEKYFLAFTGTNSLIGFLSLEFLAYSLYISYKKTAARYSVIVALYFFEAAFKEVLSHIACITPFQLL